MPTYEIYDFTLVDPTDPSKSFGFDVSLVSASTRRDLKVPNANGTLALTDGAQTFTALQTFKDTTLKVVDDADASKTLVFSLGGASAGADLTLAWAGTGDRTVTIPDAACTLAGKDLAQTWTAAQTFNAATTFDSELGLVTIQGDPSATNNLLRMKDAASGFGSTFILTAGAGLSAERTIEIPDFSGVLIFAASTQTLSNKTLGTNANTLRASTSSSGVAFVDNTTTSKAFRFVLSGLTASTNNTFTLTGTAVRDWKWEDVPGSMVVVGNGADPPATDAIGKVNQTGKTAAIASTNLTNSTPAGLYRISYFLRCTTADAAAGTISVSFVYTDDVGSTTDTSATVALTATTNRTQDSLVVYLASGNITYSTTLTGSIGSSQYQLRARAEYLG